jgi:hypothetical protein
MHKAEGLRLLQTGRGFIKARGEDLVLPMVADLVPDKVAVLLPGGFFTKDTKVNYRILASGEQ